MKGYITVGHAAQKSDFTREWVRVLIRRAKVTAVKKGNRWYLFCASFDNYLAKQRKGKRRGRPKKKLS